MRSEERQPKGAIELGGEKAGLGIRPCIAIHHWLIHRETGATGKMAMVSLAQRIRDFRYAKGWGPDELASRAEISRTALYQIESGKTGLPRAGTLRRIALALDVSMDQLLGEDVPSMPRPGERTRAATFRGRETRGWMPAEGGPLNLPPPSSRVGGVEDRSVAGRPASEPAHRAMSTYEGSSPREEDLTSKLHDLLRSPMGSGVARVLDDLHDMMVRSRSTR